METFIYYFSSKNNMRFHIRINSYEGHHLQCEIKRFEKNQSRPFLIDLKDKIKKIFQSVKKFCFFQISYLEFA